MARKRAHQKPSSKTLVVTLVVAVLVGLSLAVIRLLPEPSVDAPSGAALGSLPRGVAAQDLSLLIVTLDTTRADRIGSYGFAEIETPSAQT